MCQWYMQLASKELLSIILPIFASEKTSSLSFKADSFFYQNLQVLGRFARPTTDYDEMFVLSFVGTLYEFHSF